MIDLGSVNVPVLVYVLVSLAAIGTLSYFLITSENQHRDNFCTGSRCLCTGARNKTCQCAGAVKKAYQAGVTEYSKFPNKGWSNVHPGDMNYPTHSDCNKIDGYLKKLV